jgi:protoporphyrin/coproporphyrin ferrochelatase
MIMSAMFDSVLIVSFGGPQGRDDIRPFLANVLRGRRVAPERVEEVAHHYELFDGVSPLTELTRRQAAGLRERLIAAGHPLPVYIGMRNWHPYLTDTLKQMHADGARRAIAFIAAAHHSYSSCQQYRENIASAQQALRNAGGHVEITFVDSWFDHAQFIAANASHVRDALNHLPRNLRDNARIVFTAHSIPKSMAEASQYEHQLSRSCAAIAEQVGRDWALVYQSRSGRPQDPWLEPDVCDYLRREHQQGLAAAVICPVGFVCDHIEVLYDLDREAADVCASIGLPMIRAAAVNDDPLFLDMMTDVVLRTMRRYETGRPLPIVNRA